MRTGNRRAAWVLVLLAPVVAELGLGSTPPSMAYLVLLWLPIYGAGVLLVRELVCRTGRGWASVVALGFGYELVEDGIGLQALSSPHLYDAAGWGPRVLGLNLPYWEANALYHVVFSVVVPIVLVNLLFPAHRDKPYLKKGGVVVTAVVWLLGIVILRVSVPPTMDPGYAAPLPVLVGVVVAVVALGVVALRVLPRATTAVDPSRSAPSLPALWVAGAGCVLLLVFLTFPLHGLGAEGPAFLHGDYVYLSMAVALLVAAAAYVVVRRWHAAPSWTDRHTLALTGGALLAHTAAGTAVFWPRLNTVDVTGLALFFVATAVLVALLDRRLRSRERALVAGS